MNTKLVLGVIMGITLVTTLGTTPLLQQVYAANWVDPEPIQENTSCNNRRERLCSMAV